MPVGWKPKESRLEQLIAEEEARIETLRQKRFGATTQVEPLEPQYDPGITPLWEPSPDLPPPPSYPESIPWLSESTTTNALAEAPLVTAPAEIKPAVEPIPSPPETAPVPFWQRALQVFTAPFEWVDENIIKPTLSLAVTTMGFVNDVEREPGEDFWDWKRRSWAGWDAPGININVPWSDQPWRLNLKGVMELAPWLLIPGAGQVGTGIRAATGIAGFLGKAGKVGRLLGTAVEYSPWGLVEKSAGVAIKGGFRVAGNVTGRVSTAVGEKLFGKYVPPPVPESVNKLTNYVKEVVMPGYKAFRKEVPGLRARQEKGVQDVFAKYRRGEITFENISGELNKARSGGVKSGFALTPEALAARQEKVIAGIEARVVSGELSEKSGKMLLTKIRKSSAYTAVPFETAEVKELSDMIVQAAESGLVKAESRDAFLDLLLTGTLPQKHNIRDWASVFGPDFAQAVGRLNATTADSFNQMVDIANLPRALLASMDLSATFRQGLFLSLLHPTKMPIWFGKQVKSLLSEKLSLGMDDALRARPLFNDFVAQGGYIAPLRRAIPTKAEELFMSDIARRIPGIRRSERAFITYLNEARMTAYEAAHGAMTAQGATTTQFKTLTDFINMASGRGTLPKSLEKYSPALNTVLFSPRLQAATLQLPRQIGRMLISKNPYMRKEAAKALVTFVGGGSAIIGLLKATGNKVELDPRSGDFGKIIVGETRLDIWRGYLQYIRFTAQMLTGERKLAYGNMNTAERSEIASRFLQSKSSPGTGLLVDLLRGEDYMGNPIFRDTTGFSKTAMQRVLPLVIQDIIDAVEQSGINGSWVAAPAMLGIGSLTIVNDFVRIKEKIARDMGYDSWDDIDPKKQREIENRNAELQAANIAFDRQIMGTAWGDWRLAGKAIDEVFRQNIDNATAQYRQTGDGYNYREKVADAWTARRGGYDVREREARFEDIVKRLKVKDTMEAAVSLGPEQMAIKAYTDALFGDDMYDEFGDYRFDEAEIRKEQLRQALDPEMFKYVEDYQSIKFETYPPEFLELMQAKIVMKPYWQVTDRVIKLFGQRFAESSSGQSLITKLKKQKRLSDSDLEKYYQMFYAQS